MNTQAIRVVVSGMLAGVPDQGGATWAVLQYVLGLRALGHDVVFVEEVDDATLDDPDVRRYFENVALAFDLQGRAALVGRGTRRTVGIDRGRLLAEVKGADLTLNLSGNLTDAELLGSGVRVYLDLDPGFTQLWQAACGLDMRFDAHDVFVTVGLAMGSDACDVPTCGRRWLTTTPPVVLDRWRPSHDLLHDAFTTVAHGRGYGSISHDGKHYGQKVHSLRDLVDLPERTWQTCLLALAIDPGDEKDIRSLCENGWLLVATEDFPRSPDDYRRFVRGSKAEIGVAKSGYVRSRSGWFSDRSACYLAAGRPVVAQDTGFSDVLPCGEGLLAFDDASGAAIAIEHVAADYERHREAARAIAAAYLDSRLVLPTLLDAIGDAA